MSEHDAFESLRLASTAESPRPDFARGLRVRIEAALRMPPGGTNMTITPYLTVHDGHAAIEWYRDALGARLVGDVIDMGDGRVGHAELDFGGAHLFLSDEAPSLGVVSPQTLGGTTCALTLIVPDVDAVFARAVERGATPQREPADQPYGFRGGALYDPYGHRWMIQSPLA